LAETIYKIEKIDTSDLYQELLGLGQTIELINAGTEQATTVTLEVNYTWIR